MASLFNKDNESKPALSNYDKIESEVAHLKKKTSSRDQPGARKIAPWFFSLIIFGVIWIYMMDPCFHALYKGQAINAYLYLHNYGSGPMADNLVATKIFSEDEVTALNRKKGSYQDYYVSVEAATTAAQSIIDYMNGVKALHDGKYDELSTLNKVRYVLFIKSGIETPIAWDSLDPSVSQD